MSSSSHLVHDYSRITPSEAASITDEDYDTILSSIPVHEIDAPKFKSKTSPSCRALVFSPSGDTLYTASNGGSLAAINVDRASNHKTSDNAVLWKIDKASPNGISAIYHMHPKSVGECIVTGDDEGVIRIWDVRKCGNGSSNAANKSESKKSASKKSAFDNLMALPSGCVSSFHEHSDFISSFQVDAECNTLLAASSDGVLTIIDLRKGGGNGKQAVVKKDASMKIEPVQIDPKTVQGPFRLHRKSDNQEDELLSMCLMKHGKKLVVGTQQGVLNFWSWGTWGDISDRFPGHPQSIDALLKIDEDTLLSGSSDGVVRVLQVQPDQLLGVLGDHDGFPIEKLQLSMGNKVVGSLSHDCNIRMWDASIFYGDDDDDDDEGMENMDSEAIANSVAGAVAKGGNGNSEDEWEDVDSDDSMDGSDSDSDMKKGGKKPKFKTENDEFFSDF